MKRWIGLDVGGTSLKVGLYDHDLRRMAAFDITRQQLKAYEPDGDADLLAAALKALNLRPSPEFLSGIAAGWAGYARLEDQRALEQALSVRFPDLPFGIFSDAMAAHASAFAGQDGLLSIHGTGSLQLIKRGSAWIRLNGYGPQVGDIAGGLALGRAGIRKALLQIQTGSVDGLAAAFLHYTGSADWVQWVVEARHQPELVAGFVPALCDLAGQGDPAAGQILDEELNQLAQLVKHAGIPAGTPFFLHGGLTRNEWIRHRLTALYEGLGLSRRSGEADAAQGAVILLKQRLEGHSGRP